MPDAPPVRPNRESWWLQVEVRPLPNMQEYEAELSQYLDGATLDEVVDVLATAQWKIVTCLKNLLDKCNFDTRRELKKRFLKTAIDAKEFIE